MSLPDSWVDRIFGRMAVRYGAAWLRMWEGIPIEAVKADWALELHQLQGESLAYALDHLPERPPNVAQFKALCLSRSPAEVPRLPGPRDPIPTNIADKLREIWSAQGEQRPKAWAYAMREREKAGEVLTPAQKAMWREALRQFDLPDAEDQKRTAELKAASMESVRRYAEKHGIPLVEEAEAA